MTLQGHAVRQCVPMPRTLPIRWEVTTWCGLELAGVMVPHGVKTSGASCEACRQAQEEASSGLGRVA